VVQEAAPDMIARRSGKLLVMCSARLCAASSVRPPIALRAREDALFAAYLCCPAADCFVGQVFPVSGGWATR
jgi:hypothetical protein